MEKKTIELLAPAGKLLHIPVEVIPVFIVRIFSSSAAVSFVLDIFKEYGPDSRLGMIVSIMMSCTETVIYTITIYYMSVNIKKTRWTLPGAMFATIAGAVASVAITELIMRFNQYSIKRNYYNKEYMRNNKKI